MRGYSSDKNDCCSVKMMIEKKLAAWPNEILVIWLTWAKQRSRLSNVGQRPTASCWQNESRSSFPDISPVLPPLSKGRVGVG